MTGLTHLSSFFARLQAPVSLVAALQEYLDDPNFEENRSEYKQNKDVADGKSKPPVKKAEPSKRESPVLLLFPEPLPQLTPPRSSNRCRTR